MREAWPIQQMMPGASADLSLAAAKALAALARDVTRVHGQRAVGRTELTQAQAAAAAKLDSIREVVDDLLASPSTRQMLAEG